MSSILPNGKTQFIDQNGAPLASGQVFFYAPGTSNPQATYQDQALTIANTNPVQLDSRGQAVIWGSGTYRQVVRDASGVTIWDQVIADATGALGDQIAGITTDLAAGTGSSLVGFQQGGGSAQARTVQDKLREAIVSPQDFMTAEQINNVYLRLGNVDVSAAIAAAITAAGPGGEVYFPPGYYGVTSSILVSDATRIRGAGRFSSVIVPVGNFDVFSFNGGSGTPSGASLTSMGFSAAGMTGGNLIATTNSHRLLFADIVATSPYNGFSINWCNSCSIRDVWINGVTGQWGVKWWGTTNKSDVLDLDNVVMSGVSASPTATGILMDGFVNTLDMRHVACTSFNRGLWTVNNSGSSSNFPSFITAYDFQCDFPNQEAIRLEGGIRQCHFTDLYAHGSKTAQNIYIDSSATLITFKGGKSDGAFLEGIYINGTYCFLGAGFQVSSNGQQASGTISGIRIGSNSIATKVIGAHAGSWVGVSAASQNYGVQIDAGAQGYVVTGNTLRTNVTGDILDNAKDPTSLVFGNSGMSSPWTTGFAIQSMAGDLPLNAAGTGTVKLGNASNGVGFGASSLASSVNFAKAFGNATGSAPTLQAVGSDANVSLKLSTTGTGSVVSGANMLPSNDNAFSCGGSGSRWSTIWAANGTIQTSDQRDKTDITDSALGLDFVNSLRPVSYKWKVGGQSVKQTWLDTEGTPIADGQPVPEDAVPGPDVVTPRPGVRTHWGFIAQEVKAACDAAGVDFGGWVLSDESDPNSQQAIRPDEIIAPLVKAVQQLSQRISKLESPSS
jgi:hypothetical protein